MLKRMDSEEVGKTKTNFTYRTKEDFNQTTKSFVSITTFFPISFFQFVNFRNKGKSHLLDLVQFGKE